MLENTLEKVQQLSDALSKTSTSAPCFLGFDGFTDDIMAVVDQRPCAESYSPMTTISQLGTRISEATGKSCNIELVPLRRKIGGNGPIMASALTQLGHEVRYAGAIGEQGQIEPLFLPLAKACRTVYPLLPSGHSQALEFHDGKVILGKLQSLLHMDYNTLMKHMGSAALENCLEHCALFGSLNWTMLPHMTEIWRHLRQDIVPSLSRKPRWMFIDLADPAKRSNADVEEALQELSAWNTRFRVVLGINKAEAERLGQVCGLPPMENSEEALQRHSERLQATLHVEQILIHTPRLGTAAWNEGSAQHPTFFCEQPSQTTGAGDNFNAGYCHALLNELTPEQALLTGMATAGYYIRKAEAPRLNELQEFLVKWAQTGL